MHGLVVQILVTLGGVAALSWELVWQLQASLALGVSALGTAITLAATMAGFTIGSLGMGQWLRGRDIRRPTRLYGCLELVIGISGLLVLSGFGLLEALDSQVYSVSPTLAPLLHTAGIVLLLGPPTFAMGATIPTFQLIARRHGVSVSALYGLNTAGASLGVLLISFVMLPGLGVANTCLIVGGLNVSVFLATFLLSDEPLSREEPVSIVREGRPRLEPVVAGIVVFGTGFVTFGLEVAWFRAMRAAFWSTTHTFAIILASVLIPLAIGARLVPWMRRRGISPGATLACAGAAILLATPLVERMDLFATGPTGYLLGLASWLALSLAIVGPPMLLLGMALPWCLEEYPDPAASGRLYGLNTLGAVFGALIAAWILLPALGFARSAWLLGGVVVALAMLASHRRTAWIAALAGAGSLAVAAALTSSPGRDRMQGKWDSDGVRVLGFDEGPDSTASVIERPNGMRLLMIDGFVASGENMGGHYMQWMGSLPMLLHPDPRQALVICFGTGQTAHALLEEGPERLDIVELSPAVLEMGPLFESNHGVLEDPRVQAIVMDGRAWLRRSDRRYDVITLEPMPPNFAGVNALYSREFYEIMSEKLLPGGVVAQWLPFHMLEPDHVTSVAATFLEVFPDSVLWVDPITGIGILLGRLAGAPRPLGEEWPGLARRLAKRSLEDQEIRRGLLLGPEDLERYAAGGTVISDDNQLLSFGGVRAGLRGTRARTVGRANAEVINRFAPHPPFRIQPADLKRKLTSSENRGGAE